ncbi:MAG: efflux RND transporter periplasmic adaptor subunit [Bacteroidales bacterium]|nr:efflux RND transporter periplasmic adaptor subunit [Bacteroidales bacterium]HRX31026.1 efflux RND transporter periplasmic adaptor subunit [Tenuifilaceae bacterium]
MKRFFMVFGLLSLIACTNNKQVQENKPTNKGIKVVVSPVKEEVNYLNLKYSGTVEASKVIPLTFRTSGTIEKISVDVGDRVVKGQLLASIDKTDMQNIYNVTRAKYEQAKDAYDRLKSVHDQGSLPEIKWVEMETNLEQAKSSLEIAKNNLDKCDLRSPVDGVIGRKNIEPGQSAIGASISPIELVEIETVYVKVSVPENEISKIKKGQSAVFIVSALDDKQFQGVVTNVSPVADVISRTYTVKIKVENPKYELKPGMVCDVTLKINQIPHALTVPYSAVSKDDNGNTFVYTVSNDGKHANKQVIETGFYNGSNIEVTKGVSKGELVISEGINKLSDNCLIEY